MKASKGITKDGSVGFSLRLTKEDGEKLEFLSRHYSTEVVMATPADVLRYILREHYNAVAAGRKE